MSASILWGPIVQTEDLTPLFHNMQQAAEYYSAFELEIMPYMDDAGVTFPRGWCRQAHVGDVLIQAFLFDKLHRIDMTVLSSGGNSLNRGGDVGLYIESPPQDRVTVMFIQSTEIPQVENESETETLNRVFPNLGRILIFLSVFQGVKGGSADVVGPEMLSLPDVPLTYVTSGSQAGLGGLVEHYRLYWSRFLAWNQRLYRIDGRRCAIDLNYVESLASEVSILGFLHALNNRAE